jgi:hypothetical protein
VAPLSFGAEKRSSRSLRRAGSTEPTIDPDVAQAEQLLSNFAEFWEIETTPVERRRLLLSLFEQVWEDEGQIVAVKPRAGLVPYFQAAAKCHETRSGFSGAQSGSDGTRTRDLRRDRKPLYLQIEVFRHGFDAGT